MEKDDEREMEDGRYVRQCSMDGACPQCRVQVEVEDNGYMRGKWRENSRIYMYGWYPLIFFPFSFSLLFSRNFYYLLIDVGRIVKRRMNWIGEWRTVTYEKVWIKGGGMGGRKTWLMDARLEDMGVSGWRRRKDRHWHTPWRVMERRKLRRIGRRKFEFWDIGSQNGWRWQWIWNGGFR